MHQSVLFENCVSTQTPHLSPSECVHVYASPCVYVCLYPIQIALYMHRFTDTGWPTKVGQVPILFVVLAPIFISPYCHTPTRELHANPLNSANLS